MPDPVPISVTPMMVDPLRTRDHTRPPGNYIDDPLLDACADALLVARNACEQARSGTSKIVANRMNTVAHNVKTAAATNHQLMQSAAAKVDAVHKTLTTMLGELEKKIAPPVAKTNAVEAMNAIEIRGRLAAMTADDRNKLLGSADDVLIGAVAGSEAWLSGMGPADVNLAIHNWQRKRWPGELAQIEKINKAVDLLQRSGELTVRYITGLTDSDVVKAAEASERDAHEAQRAAEVLVAKGMAARGEI